MNGLQLATGAKGVTIPVPAYSKIYLPDILDLKDKNIKFLDCLNNIISADREGNAITTNINGVFVNLMQKETQKLFFKNLPVSQLCFPTTYGERKIVNRYIDLINSFVVNETANDVNLFFVFWYDDNKVSNPYSETQENNIDSVEVRQFSQVENKVYFDEQRTLVGKQITFFDFDLTGGFTTPQNNTCVGSSVLYSSFLTLQKNNYKFVENVPLACFSSMYLFNKICLSNVVFDFTNSFIEFPISEQANVIGKAFFANVYYKRN